MHDSQLCPDTLLIPVLTIPSYPMKTPPRCLVASLVALALAAGCSKDDDSATVRHRIRVTPELLPVPNCDDPNGEGVPEIWNSSEDSLMFGLIPRTNRGGLSDSDYVRSIRLTSHRIPIGTPLIQWSAVIGAREAFVMDFRVVDRSSGMVESYASESLSDHDADSARKTFNTRLSPEESFSKGCKRLYYTGIIPRFRQPSAAIRAADSITVLFRGHFDVEMY